LIVVKVYRDGKYSSPKCVIVNGRRESDKDITPGPSDYAPCRKDTLRTVSQWHYESSSSSADLRHVASWLRQEASGTDDRHPRHV